MKETTIKKYVADLASVHMEFVASLDDGVMREAGLTLVFHENSERDYREFARRLASLLKQYAAETDAELDKPDGTSIQVRTWYNAARAVASFVAFAMPDAEESDAAHDVAEMMAKFQLEDAETLITIAW